VADWLSGIDPADVVRIEVTRVTLSGVPSCVTSARLLLHFRDGSTAPYESAFEDKIYETFRADVAALNRILPLTRRRRD